VARVAAAKAKWVAKTGQGALDRGAVGNPTGRELKERIAGTRELV